MAKRTKATESSDSPSPPADGGEPVAPGVAIMLPLTGALPSGFVGHHIDLRLTHWQALALRMIYDGLDVTGQRLASGRRVQNTGDAIRWLLEQAAKEIVPDDPPRAAA